MSSRKTLPERKAARERIREHALAQAERTGLTIRCASLLDDMDNPDHGLCRGETPGGAGCLCRCHDAAAGG